MKLVMTLLVRDEEDVLREHLDFHLTNGVDHIILMDNLSTDGTAEIAREYERAGLLHYMFQPRDDYAQGHWVTQMARRASQEFHADWVINSDADEFWLPDAGSLKDALASLGPSALTGSAARVNFAARIGNGEPFWQRMDARWTTTVNALGLPLPDKIAHRARPDIVVDQGNHRVFVGGETLPGTAAPITILHFPIRSRAQYLNKIVKGGAAYGRNTELRRTVGDSWRYLYRLHLVGKFDQVYDREFLTDDQVVAGLEDGTLVRDDRLIDALATRARLETPA